MLSNHNPASIDPRLKALLDKLRPTPARHPAAVARGRARFMEEVDALFETRPQPDRASPFLLAREKLASFRIGLGQRTALASLGVTIAILVLLFGSVGMTAFAAQSALPGDALYSVKTRLEETRLGITSNAALQVEMHHSYAERRLGEIEKLIAEGRFADTGKAAQEFQIHINKALVSLSDVSTKDPETAARLALQITNLLSRYTKALSNMASSIPEPTRQELEKAMLISPNGSVKGIKPDGEIEFTALLELMGTETWQIGGQSVRINAQTMFSGNLAAGLLVRVRATLDPDGNLIAREIELAEGVPDNNGNGGTPDANPIGDDSNAHGAQDYMDVNGGDNGDRTNNGSINENGGDPGNNNSNERNHENNQQKDNSNDNNGGDSHDNGDDHSGDRDNGNTHDGHGNENEQGLYFGGMIFS
jgi:hypothetical protein